jgi:hypothetical protein
LYFFLQPFRGKQIDALMFATCFEASYNGETPWEEVSDRARGEEEERAG